MIQRVISSVGARLTAVVVVTSPAIVFAADAPGESEPSLFAGDIGNAIVTLVIFVGVLIVLGKFAWNPILAALQRREQFIRESLEDARRDREQAEQALREREAELRKASEEAAAVLDRARRDGEQTRNTARRDSRAEGDAMIDRAKREITAARDAAVRDLHDLVANLATDVAVKMLRRSLSEDEHRRLIEASLGEIRDQLGRNNGANHGG
jgi:F-type H+-transporting ATPase subunit b